MPDQYPCFPGVVVGCDHRLRVCESLFVIRSLVALLRVFRLLRFRRRLHQRRFQNRRCQGSQPIRNRSDGDQTRRRRRWLEQLLPTSFHALSNENCDRHAAVTPAASTFKSMSPKAKTSPGSCFLQFHYDGLANGRIDRQADGYDL